MTLLLLMMITYDIESAFTNQAHIACKNWHIIKEHPVIVEDIAVIQMAANKSNYNTIFYTEIRKRQLKNLK